MAWAPDGLRHHASISPSFLAMPMHLANDETRLYLP
jgi:hypothetical protein